MTRTPSLKTNSPLLGAIEGSIAPRSMRVAKAARQSSRLAAQKRSSGLPLFVAEWCLVSTVQLPERMSLHVAASLSTVFVSRVPHSATSMNGCATGISSTSTFPVCFWAVSAWLEDIKNKNKYLLNNNLINFYIIRASFPNRSLNLHTQN